MKQNTKGLSEKHIERAAEIQRELESMRKEAQAKQELHERLAQMVESSDKKKLELKPPRRRSQNRFAPLRYEPPKWWRGTRVA